MSKKILFWNTSKLATLSAVLLLLVFSAIGMSFAPGEEEVISTDSVTGTPTRVIRTSHGCDGDSPDYAKTVAVSLGNGTVYVSTSSETKTGQTGTTGTPGEANSTSYITWNCGSSSSNDTQVKYCWAEAKSGYHFVKWTTNSNGSGSTSTNNPYGFSVTASSTNSNSPTTGTIYAVFEENPTYTITFKTTENGSYKYTYGSNSAVTVTSEHSVTTKENFNFTATPDPGYKVYGWYTLSGTTKTYISYFSNTLSSYALTANQTFGVDFISESTPIFIVKGSSTHYFDFQAAANAAASSSSKVFLPYADCSVPAGNYNIPSGVTLLIPFSSDYTVTTKPTDVQTWANLSQYRKLSLLDGANITVASGGAICVASRQFGTSSGNPGPGSVLGAYGVLDMSAGGHITIASGANLYVYGFITGTGDQSTAGTITIQNGGNVYENLVINDLHGGGGTAACVNGSSAKNSYKLFPFNQYFVQNIEPRMTIEYGGSETVYFDIQSSQGGKQDAAKLIGNTTSHLFQLSSGASITKWYDASRDYQCYVVRGSMTMNGISVNAVVATLSSTTFILPVNNNMEIRAASGATLSLPYSMKFQPGSGLIIDEGATVNISDTVYFYDHQDWDKYAMGAYAQTFGITTAGKNLPWHTLRNVSSTSALGHASLVVDGTLNINSSNGALYTSSHGGAITSHGTGKIVYNKAGASANRNLYECWGTYGKNSDGTATKVDEYSNVASGQVLVGSYSYGHSYRIYGTPVSCTPAQLRNGDDSFTQSSGVASGTTVDYKHGHWGWKIVWRWDDGTPLKTMYYHSQPNSSWISSNAPSTDRPAEGTCTYVFNNWSTETNDTWHEINVYANYTKTCANYYTVTWKSEDGNTTYDSYSYGEGETTQFNGEIPTKATNWTTYTIYEFDGWTTEPNGGGTFYANGSTPAASAEATYYAHYNAIGMAASVTVAGETTYYLTFAEAFKYANTKGTSTITILNDNSGTNERQVYTVTGGTCTLDLNGHTTRGAVPYTSSSIIGGLIVINASGSTFTITDNSANKDGRLENICAQNQVTYGVLVLAGTLNVNGGIIHAENPAQYASKANTDLGVSAALTSCGARAVQISAAQKLNITGGRLESYATRNAYGIVATGNTANTTQVTIAGGEVYAEAPCGAYGISCTGKLDMSAGLVEAKLNEHLVDAAYAADNADYNLNKHQTCYTIIMGGSASATASSCYYGTLTVTGGTIKASSDLERSYTSNVYAIYMNVSVAGMGNRNFASTSGTNAEQACAVGSIKNATIDVLNKGNNAFGISVFGKYNSKDRTNTVFKVENTNITVKAYNYAYGVYANGGINGTTGECFTGDVEMTNCTVLAEAYKAAYAYPAFVYSGATTIFQEDQSNYYGEYATAAKMTINGGSYTAKAKTHYAYAAVANTRARSTYGPETKVYANRTQGGHAEAYPTLIINGGTFVAKTEQQHARGVSSGGNTTVTDATFHVTAGTYNTYGLYAISGKLTATNVIVNDTAKSHSSNSANVYGVLVDCSIPSGNTAQTGFAYAGEVELNNCTITAVSPSYSNARALYVNATNKLHNWTQFLADSTSNTSTWAANKNNYAALYRRIFPCTIEGRDSVSVAIAGKATVNGGTFTAKAGKASAYGAVSTQTSVPANREVTASPVMNLYNATFIAQTGTSTNAYGVQSGGPTLIDGCTIMATAGNPTRQSTASGVRALDKTTTIRNSTITATASDVAYGLEGYVEINGTHGYCWHGEYDLTEAGTTEVTANATGSSKKAYTIFLNATNKAASGNPSGNFAGDYATAANATINGGTYTATINGGSNGYAIALQSKQTRNEAVAQPEVLVNGGKFNGATAELGTAGVVGHMQLNGGYYAHQTNLDTYKVAPKQVLPTTDADKAAVGDAYNYKIVEAYTITFMNGSSQLQTGLLEAGIAPVYAGDDPVGPSGDDYSSEFDGWSLVDGGDKLVSLPNVSGDATYYAHYIITEKKHTVTIAAGEHGSASPASVFVGGITPSSDITATPDAGYRFVNWTIPTGVTAAAGYSATSNPIQINATADGKTITANFTPRTDISYTVKHWKQNINDDNYTEVTADQETKQGTFNTLTAATAKSYTGFTAQTISQQTIAADGAIVNVYYNREKYTVTWKNGDATLETDLNVKYGATPSYDGATPTKAATAQYTYTFTGWSPTVSSVTGNATYTAQFSETVNKYTVTWKNGDVTIETDTEVPYGTTPSYDGATPTKAATAQYTYTFTGWSPTVSSVTGNTTYTAQFSETVNKYTVTWKNGDVTIETDTEVPYGATPSYDGATPTKAATAQYTYTFTGWSPTVSSVTGNTTYTAQFSETVNKYTVTWKNGDVTIETDTEVPYGTTPTYNGATPTKAQDAQYTYTFSGWSPTVSSVTGDATYTAQYESHIRSYDITFVNLDGKNGSSRTVSFEYGQMPACPVSPEKVTDCETYPFIGWSPELATVTGATTYTAQFSNTPEVTQFTVTFNVQEHGVAPANQSVDCNTTVAKPADPTAEGYTFGGWYKEAGCIHAWDFDNDVVAGTTTLFAYWSINSYTITFNSNGGTSVASITQNYGTSVTAPANPTKTGYTFAGWVPAVPSTMPASNTECVAQWTANTNTPYTVNHFKQKLDGTYAATPDDTDNLTGTTASSVTPDRKSYTGFTAPAGQTVTILANGSLVVEYKYTRNSYTLSWVTDGDALAGTYTSGSIKYGASITAPNTPTKTGYTFAGWSNGTSVVTPATTMPAAATTYTATWTANEYGITYKDKDNAAFSGVHGSGYPTTHTYGTQTTLVNPTKTGYTFDGWYTTSNCSGSAVTTLGATAYTSAITLYAKWTINQYTITFNSNGGSAVASITADYGASVIAPANPTKTGYDFTGWSPAVPSTMPLNGLTCVAQWEIKHYTITWVINGVSTSEQVEHGTVPTHATPEKVIDNCKYEFLHWDVEPVAATADATYTAVFSDDCTMDNFLVVFQNYDGTPLYATEVAGGETPVYAGEEPVKAGEDFSGWSPTLSAISSHMVYTAQFSEPAFEAERIKNGVRVSTGTWATMLSEANQAANAGSTIKLHKDVTATNGSSISQNMTIDLNGCTISCSTSSRNTVRLFYVNNTALTIEDSQEGGKIYYEGQSYTTYYAIYVGGTGSVTVNGGIIQAHGNYYYSNNYKATAAAIYLYSSNATLNMYGGNLVGSHSNNSGNAYSVYFRGTNYGRAYVYGGKLDAKTNIFQGQSAARVQLTGGYYSKDPGNTVTIPNTHQKITPTELSGYSHKVVKKAGQTCTITWKQDDGAQINQTTVTSGGMPTHADPTKDGGELHRYDFAGWNPEVAAVQNDMTYYAMYHLLVKIGWNVDGNITYSWVRFGDTPVYPGAEPTKASTAQYDYTFTGWSPEIGPAMCPKTYTAQFEETLQTYTITFKNLDGNNTQQVEYEFAYGATPVCLVTPMKEEGGKAYEFWGWTPEIAPVTDNAEYTATFSPTPSKAVYTITWKDDQGNTIETTKVAEDDLPTHVAPAKPNTAEWTYTFTGWTPAVVPATGDATYTATFSSVKNKYTITFEDWDGTVLSSELMEYGATPSISNPTREAYTFNGWSPSVTSVTADATYTATYTFSGNVASVTNAAGTSTVYYTTWADALAAANGSNGCTLRIHTDITGISSTQTISQNITLDLNGCLLSGQTSTNTGSPVAMLTVTKAFVVEDSRGGGRIYWKGTGTSVDYPVIYSNTGTASVTINSGIIEGEKTGSGTDYWAMGIYVKSGAKLYVNGGEIIANSSVSPAYTICNSSSNVTITGGKIKATGNTDANSVLFYQTNYVTASGGYYSKEPSGITIATGHGQKDVTSSEPEYADGYRYKVVKTSCVVTWLNYDGTTLATDAVSGGSTPTYGGETPTKPATEQYTYVFAGWDPELGVITDDITYTAQFTPVLRSYTITWQDGDGKTLQTGEVEYGQVPTYTSSSIPTKAATDAYTYVFNSTWSPTPHAVDDNQTYMAQFNSVARSYTITLHTNEGTINSGDVAKYTYGVGATLPSDVTRDNYNFEGWFDNEGLTGDAVTTISTTATGNKEFWAKWSLADVGFNVDIVDWTATELTINANGWTASGWPYKINGTSYEKGARAADRTLTIPYSGDAGSNLRITILDKDDNVVSSHPYEIPFIGTLSGTNASSIVYVNEGTLTISSNIELAALYVRPEASVNITNGTLTVGKLVLRTLPWQAAAISGNFTASETWYTRIAPNKRTIFGGDGNISYDASGYYQFGLPLNCTVNLSDIKVSNNANTPYGNAWWIKRYDEELRATTGLGDNWVQLSADEMIVGGVGYEIFSNSAYYREFYFPVGEVTSASVGNTIGVSCHSGNAGSSHAGWNIVTSPLMSRYDNTKANPESGLKVSELLSDGSYYQHIPDYIAPAIPFSYQATVGQTTLSFSGTSLAAFVPSRRIAAEEEPVQIQWIRLNVFDAEGRGDETSILAHPTRYEDLYKAGIDVAKQSLTASRAIIYSSHVYGDMAFAGVADSLLEQGVALTVYSPKAQELTISMRENDWLNRMEEVWLVDKETGMRVDLLWSDYALRVPKGTTTGRLFIQGVFRQPQVPTDIQNGNADGEKAKAQKVIINDKIYILVNGRMYDATGKLVNQK